MNKKYIFIWILLLSVAIAGCWDQRLLKEHNLILSIGYDSGDGGTIVKTVTFPQEVGEPEENLTAEQSEVVTTTGDTVKDAENKVDQLIPGKFDRSKANNVLLGEKLAEKGIFSTLDSIYRDLRGPLNANVAIVGGTAEDAMNIKDNYYRLISDFYSELLESAEDHGLIKNENIQSACPVILTEGEDIVLPYICLEQDSEVAVIDGLALFSGDQMTGQLNIKQSTMLLILLNQTPKKTKLSFEVNPNEEEHNKKFVDFFIRNIKRDIEIDVVNGELQTNIDLTLQIEIDEYSTDNLDKESEVKSLTKKIEEKLDKLAIETINEIQEANNDSLGIGQRIKAYHHSTWEQIDWNDVYPEMPFGVTFKVNITQHGIIN